MMVVIKDMEMPKDCSTCPFSFETERYPDITFQACAIATCFSYVETPEACYANCPLVEVEVKYGKT